MPLPINIHEILKGRLVEWERLRKISQMSPRQVLWLYGRGVGLHHQLRHQIPHGAGGVDRVGI